MTQHAHQHETVTIPARLLLHLYWAAEALSEHRFDDDDPAMLGAAREALSLQAPWHHTMLVQLDQPCR